MDNDDERWAGNDIVGDINVPVFSQCESMTAAQNSRLAMRTYLPWTRHRLGN